MEPWGAGDPTEPVPGRYRGYGDETVPADDPTRIMPPPSRRPPGSGGPGGPDDPQRRRRLILAIVGGVLAVVIIIVLLILLLSGSSATTHTTTSTSTLPTTTTSAVTTTTAGAPVSISAFNVPSTVSCSSPTTIAISWSTNHATEVVLSIDGPGAYKTYSGSSGADSVPFACDGNPHRYTITAKGNGTQASRTQTVTEIPPPTTKPPTT